MRHSASMSYIRHIIFKVYRIAEFSCITYTAMGYVSEYLFLNCKYSVENLEIYLAPLMNL